MAHHKRKRPKHRRSGCLLCKPHKLTAKVKAERRKSFGTALTHERLAEQAPAPASSSFKG
jgi:hypothetical protein